MNSSTSYRLKWGLIYWWVSAEACSWPCLAPTLAKFQEELCDHYFNFNLDLPPPPCAPVTLVDEEAVDILLLTISTLTCTPMSSTENQEAVSDFAPQQPPSAVASLHLSCPMVASPTPGVVVQSPPQWSPPVLPDGGYILQDVSELADNLSPSLEQDTVPVLSSPTSC